MDVPDSDCFAVSRYELVEQRKGIVVVDEPHRLAVIQGVKRPENGRMPKAFRDSAGIERIDRVWREVKSEAKRS